jgi:hypothetical protein
LPKGYQLRGIEIPHGAVEAHARVKVWNLSSSAIDGFTQGRLFGFSL